ncbi:hypothetical protein NP493_2472g00013 [Ridgeia piscesae]|uniref:Uncharacterized protein n=1 Tax=Ridgeia piscesae TaxID=27915 RepID=A0AAD9JGP7_RIDPI|nr:hypothetical protein NP493_2472g00013 [Ridgeia piscesae]
MHRAVLVVSVPDRVVAHSSFVQIEHTCTIEVTGFVLARSSVLTRTAGAFVDIWRNRQQHA